MSLNIKNQRAVDLVHELAALTGLTLTAAVEEAVEARLRAIRNDASGAERKAEIDRLLGVIHASITAPENERLALAEDDLYDESGLPLLFVGEDFSQTDLRAALAN
jgi:antitoxin VapB